MPQNRLVRLIAVALVLQISSRAAYSHPGGLDSNGGHTDKKTGTYHYHRQSDSPATTPPPTSPAPVRPVYVPAQPSTPIVTKPATVTRSESKSKSAGKSTIKNPTYEEMLAELISVDNLSTLGERGANPRVQKAVALMEHARSNGYNITNMVIRAVELAGYTNAQLARMTRDSLLKNHSLAASYGVLTPEGLGEMRRGRSPKISAGASSGDELSVDHIIPRAAVPQLDNVIANLEFMPLRVNESKNDSFGERQRQLLELFRLSGAIP